nr:pentapeptide repeat-containing protein [Leptolyngbya sp. NIES-2104]
MGAGFTRAKLQGADFNRTKLSFANLSDAILICTNFFYANLRDANFIRADLRESNLIRADLSSADLREVDLRESSLMSADLRGADLSRADLAYANLNGADLRDANLWRCRLSHADFSFANLSNTLLSASELIESNLTSANLTGACIQDWNINRVQLDNIICEYVYWKYEWSNQERRYLLSDRRPSDPNCTFAPGEFTTLIQQALETVDLVFVDGINWQVFFQSFQELRLQYNDLSIQAIEKKSDGAFVIRLEVPAEADKAAIESQAKELYDMKLQFLETQYRAELDAKDREIEIYKRQSTDMIEIVKLQASRSIHITAIAGSQAMGDRNIHMGSGNYNERIEGNYIQGNYTNMSQDLTQAAQQIQNLLQQLQNQGVTVEAAQQQVATDMAKQAKSNPAMMGKLVLWGKAMANKASETTVSEAAKVVFTLALKAAGLS